MQRLLPPALVVSLLVAMGVLTLAVTDVPTLTSPWRWFGAAPLIGGAAMAFGGSRLFASLGTNIMTFNDPDVLVSTGLFGRSRNPMYLGFLFVLVGATVLFGSLAAVVGPVVFFVVADRWYIPFEEQRMADVFGDAYAEYASDVRRWL